MKGIEVNNTEDKKSVHFPIVAIGASAGGLEAFSDLLKSLPPDTGMSYIYIQHLDPNHESRLTEIVSRLTDMPVEEAKEKMLIKPDHVYIIPPNREMQLLEGSLTLSARPVRPQRHLPINQFFSSLAETYQEKAIGILLSGNPPDGTLGMRAIKAAGGITFAQDSTAKFEGMPKNAISEEAVDLVLSPKRMAEELVKLSLQQEKYQQVIYQLEHEMISVKDEQLTSILNQVQRLTGVDFGHYKINTIKRRIVRRMILLKMETLQEYTQYLRQHSNEVSQLYQDLLINVTTFFRDTECTDYLKKNILPKIVATKVQNDTIRLWIPACSTGQEAYSLAILLMEVLGDKAATTNVQIFATDLSELAINKARLGIYSKDEVAEIPQKRLDRFFVKIDGSYRIIKSIRDLCIFATHNALKDPPFSRLDLVSCCNLMIYLEPILQKKLVATFHYSLNSTGYLVLGKSETIGSSGYLFNQVDKKVKVFLKKKDAAAKALFELSYKNTEHEKDNSFGRKNVRAKFKSEDIDLDKLVDQVLLGRYTPACVLVNQDLDIVQFRGSTGLFLEPAPGKASLNLMKMARPGLGFELRNIVHKATKSGEGEIKSWLETSRDNKTRNISIEAIPLKHDGDNLDRYFLVVFAETPITDKGITDSNIRKDKRVKQLEAELNALKEDMRSIVEEQEAANEELQSVNEEIVSSNEELQSINEELETSKEELESSNEELITINQELQMRNEQLAEVQEYSEAIFTTIRESLLILDKSLRIKNANSCFYQTFHVTEEETEGKLLYDVGSKQWNIPRLKELLEEIIPRNQVMNNFEVRHTFPGIGEKVMILNARRLISKLRNEQLILLAIEDVTKFVEAEKLIAEKEQWFRNLADNSPMMIWVTDINKNLQFVNKAWLEYRDMVLSEAIGSSWLEEMHPDDAPVMKKLFDDSFSRKKPFTAQYRLKHGTQYKPILIKANPNYDYKHQFTGYIGSCVELESIEV